MSDLKMPDLKMPDLKMPDAVTLLNISKRFLVDSPVEGGQQQDGVFTALDNVSFNLKQGTCNLICGANGSGKSLLMAIIAGLETPSSGTVQTSGKVGLIFQESDSQILGETAREDIAFGPQNSGLSKAQIKERVTSALAETGLEAKADWPARSLSGGEKRRLAVAGVLAMDSQIIIFDEPYANMDFLGVIQVNRLIQKLHHDDKTIIILTHEIEKCMALADRFLVLCQGKIVFDGSTEQALCQNLEAWGIRHPLHGKYGELKDLAWL